jgi:hypothetical protein
MGLAMMLVLPKWIMRRSHKIIFFLITLLALATFVFGVLQLVGAKR